MFGIDLQLSQFLLSTDQLTVLHDDEEDEDDEHEDDEDEDDECYDYSDRFKPVFSQKCKINQH